MSDTQIDQLRDALRREAQHIQPVGLGVETVQRRGRHRRNRGRTLVAVGAVTCVAGLGASVVQRQGDQGPRTVDVAQKGSSAGTPPPALDFRTVPGTLAYTAGHFTTAGGVTYALATAPGVAGVDNRDQAIYRTTDGEHWTVADQSSSWIADLTEREGVLYAVGSAPGAANAADVRYRVATSNDDGKAWANTDLPFDLSTPSATVPVSKSSSVQIASSPTATVALLTEQFYPDVTALAQARAGNTNVSTEMTDDGFVIHDISDCQDLKRVDGSGVVAKFEAADGLKRLCAEPPVLGTITWSDIGLGGPSDLTKQQVLVSTDGKNWDAVDAPSLGRVRDLVADSGGFLVLSEKDAPLISERRPQIETTMLRSADARQWAPVALPAGLNVHAIAAGRIVGVDASGVVQTSSDGGATWNSTNVATALPAGSPAGSVWSADVGPLGFAVIANADGNPNDSNPGDNYLLFSVDGISWSATDLATAGAPANAYVMQATVGTDHIGVGYESAGAKGGTLKTTTVLATPKR